MSDLTPEVRELLAVIRDALDLPYGATPDDSERRRELRGENAIRVVFALDYILGGGLYGVPLALRTLKEAVAAHPVDYAVKDDQDPEAGR